MEFGDTSKMEAGEMIEMTLLALQDLEPAEAAKIVLSQHLGQKLNVGQIQNAASEMQDEKLWEEYANMALHEGMFNVGSVLYKALPRLFPEPDAVKVTLEVTADNQAAKELLTEEVREPFLVRLLADGMDKDSALHRVFEDQLNGHSFPEADNIVWIWAVTAKDEQTISIEVTSSGYWLDPLRNTQSYTSSAHGDK